MQQVLSKIKASLEESKNRIESGNHESHDLLPSLLLILVELLEENSDKYDKFLITQKELLKEDANNRNKSYLDLVSSNNEIRKSMEQINIDFMKKIEDSFTQFQAEFEVKNKKNTVIVFILTWLSLFLNTALLILFIIK